jgi:hypothetical protein
MTHRRIDGRDIDFVINDSPRPWRGDVDLHARGAVEQWDPATGKTTALAAGSPIRLALEPFGATLLRFSPPDLTPRIRLRSAALPSLTVRPLPEAEPMIAHGEFTSVEMSSQVMPEDSGRIGVLAHARLTKSRVDAYAFVRFHQQSPINLAADDCLLLDCWIPAGQQTRTSLLVILHEAGGGDFVADTGRSLASPGHARSFVPLSRFQHAGWTQDADGVLDATRISDVSVGWGGYLGEAGELVDFQIAPPQAGSTGSVRVHVEHDLLDRPREGKR